MTSFLNVPKGTLPKAMSKKGKPKKGDEKASCDALAERLNRLMAELPDRARSWLTGVDPSEAEKLVTLLQQVSSFLNATSDQAKISFPSLDRTLEKVLQRYHQAPVTEQQEDAASGSTVQESLLPSGESNATQIGVSGGAMNGFAIDVTATSTGNPSVSVNGPTPTRTEGNPVERIAAGINTLQAEQRKLLSAAESTKKSVQPIEQLSADIRKSGDVIAAIRTAVSKLPTEDTVTASIDKLLEYGIRANSGLQTIQTQCTQIAAALDLQQQLLNSAVEGVARLNERIDGKLDLRDVDDLFKLRNDLEPHIHAHLIRSVSKEVMLEVEHLKAKIPLDDAALQAAIAKLEGSCKRAGLISIDRLY